MVLAFTEDVKMAYLFAVLYGIGFGGRIPLLTAIRGEYFGRKAFATIMGLSQMPNNIAMMFAPLFAAYMFDTKGSYMVPFFTFSILNFLGAVLVLWVRKPKSVSQPAAPAA
jgi:MFS family permease